jgi:hypothetical protein
MAQKERSINSPNKKPGSYPGFFSFFIICNYLTNAIRLVSSKLPARKR